MAELTLPGSTSQLIAQAREGVFDAILGLCKEVKPQSFTELTALVFPTGGMDARLFGELDRAYSLWLGEEGCA